MTTSVSLTGHDIRGLHAASTTLSNGARVLAIHAPQAKTSTVVLSLRAGMRDERRAEHNGIMRLIEHMVYQDSQTIQGLSRQGDVARAGSVPGGATHMDYTEFFETGSTQDLRTVAERLVDQVFFPAFRAEQLAQQIEAVATERRHRLAAAPGNVLPWPHLTGAYWYDHANGHDGSGDTDLTERVTPELLAALYRQLYHPAGAVMVALSPVPAPEAIHQLSEAFGCIAPGDAPSSNVPVGLPITQHLDAGTVGTGSASRCLAVTRAATARAVTPQVLGDLLVAEALGTLDGLEARAGVLGLGERTHDDLLVLVDDTPCAVDPIERIRAVTTAKDSLVRHAICRAMYRAEQLVVDDARLARTVARDVLLRDIPEHSVQLVTALVELLDRPALARHLMVEASQRLTSQAFASMTVRYEPEGAR